MIGTTGGATAGADGALDPAVAGAGQEVGLPLSPAQERLWFLHQLDPGDASYNIPLVLRLTGVLHEPALRSAFDATVARHEALRTRFPDRDGHPVVLVEPPAIVPVESVDLRRDPGRAPRLLAERTNAAFDLARGPLLRVALLRTDDDEHLLCLVLHHIVADGWSLNLLRAELATRYAAHLDGRAVELPEPFPYTEFARREREFADGPEADAAVAHWRERLAGAPVLDLRPTATATDEGPGGAFHTRRLTGAGRAMDALARRQRCTPFMVLLAAYQVLLHRWTRQDDFCVGVPAAGRGEPELEETIGYFSTTLVLRAELAGAPSFAELLRRVRRSVLTAFTHDRVPFERLIDELGVERRLGGSPLFQTLLTVHTQDEPDGHAGEFAGLGCAEADGGHAASKFEVMLDLRREGDDLIAVFGYRTDLFDDPWAARFARHFETLLRGALADPDAPVPGLPLLTGAEEDELLALGTGCAVPEADGEALPAALERAARTYGDDRTAVRDAAGALTYRELWEAAGALAVRLRGAGVRDGDTVGVRLPRGTRAVTAMLAAWRAGAAYLPLDPAYPSARLDFMVADTGVRVVVADPDAAEDGPADVAEVPDAAEGGPADVAEVPDAAEGGPADVAEVPDAAEGGPADVAEVPDAAEGGPADVAEVPDAAEGGPASGPEAPDAATTAPVVLAPEAPGPAGVPDPRWAAGRDHPAYVIHTSGSTGRPKGVVVPHRALAARVGWMREHYGITADDEVLQFASLSFDTHAEEIFPALIAGARLVVADPDSTLPDHLHQAAGRGTGPTVLDLPTPYWHELAGDLDAVTWPPGLRLLILGADQVQPGAVAAWRARFGDTVRVVNSYGPTETTVIAATADLGHADARHRPPIGSPIGGTTLTVCDPLGRLMPQGAAGELLVGGAGVTYGYGGRAGATARAFVPDPYGPPGSRRYRTGDLVRWRTDGRLEFLGRIDDQVKVRGFRVEPGEVETALLALDGVGRAVVTVRDEALVGYVVPERAGGDPGAPPTADAPTGPAAEAPAGRAAGGLSAGALRTALAARLPAHLVPNSLVVLDALPLTPNGKVDRLALPAPERRPDLGPGYVAPRTDAEALVGEVWTEVLGLDRAGALDDFFDLGGHSLLATRVIARIRAAAGVTVPLRTLFVHRTVETFAVAVEDLLLAEIEALTDEDAERLLAAESGPERNGTTTA